MTIRNFRGLRERSRLGHVAGVRIVFCRKHEPFTILSFLASGFKYACVYTPIRRPPQLQVLRDLKLLEFWGEGTGCGEPRELERDEGEAGEGGVVEGGVEGEEAMRFAEGVGADEEVGEDAARSAVALFSAAGRVGLKCAAGGAPDGFVHLPIDGDAGLAEKRIEEGFGPAGEGEELGIDRSGDDQFSAIPGGV